MDKNKNRYIIAAIVIVAAFVVVGALDARQTWQARASGVGGSIGNFFGSLFSPFGPRQQAASNIVPSNATATPYAPADQYEHDVVNAVQAASPAVVSITISENVPVVENCPYNPLGGLPPDMQQLFGNDTPNMTQPCDTGKTQLQQVGGGSGFIISSDGLILTNKHVVSDAGASYSVLTNDGKTYDAKVLARDPNQDLAILKIGASGLPTVTLGDSNGLELGQTAIAIGNALGQFSNTVSVGVVSGLSRTVTATAPDTGADETITGVIQTDAAINPGNSGGPLLNLRGEVIGIDTAIASGAQNIGFAIPIDQAKSAINSVKSTGEIQVPYLGVRYIPVTTDVAKQQNLPVSYGALVRGDSTGAGVAPNSPAAAAGIEAEDIILSIDGQKLDATHDLGNLIDQHNVGDAVTLVIQRGNKQLTIQATLAERPAGQ